MASDPGSVSLIEVLNKALSDESKTDKDVVKQIKEVIGSFNSTVAVPPPPPKKKRNVPAPSKVGKHTEWCMNRDAMNAYCHRPLGYDALHVSAFFQPFGTSFHANEATDYTLLDNVLVDLIMASTGLYYNEDRRRESVMSILSQLPALKNDGSLVVQRYSPQATSFQTDITIVYKRPLTVASGSRVSSSYTEIPLLNVELKNELGSTGCCPVFENIGYYYHMANPEHMSPMMLVCLCGPHYLQVFGCVNFNGSIHCDPLAAPVSLLHVPSMLKRSLKTLSSLFTGVCATLLELKKFYDMPLQHTGPNIGSERLTIDQPFENNSNIWKGHYELTPVIVRFFEKGCYSIDIHKLFADKNLAPKVLETGQVSDFLHFVAMEYIPGGHLHDRLYGSAEAVALKTSLVQVLKVLERHQIVHGDLRCPNILVQLSDDGDTATGVRVIDFEWAGKVGYAVYPPTLNTEYDGWPAGVAKGSIIKPSQDVEMVDRAISSLQT